MSMQRNEIRYSFEGADEAVPVGRSKVGGRPSVPEGFAWPYYRGEGLDGEVKRRPPSFLMQIDLEEAHPYDDDALLPDAGLLCFWIRRQDLSARAFDGAWLILQCY